MIPTQLKKQSRSSAPAYSNTPPSLRKTLPPGERTQKIPAGKPVGMFFFAGGPSVTSTPNQLIKSQLLYQLS